MKLYYLDVPVELIEWVGEPEWVWCEWPDGKRWRHWYPQLTTAPWRDRA
jgi:hypothetical protein